MKKKKLTIVLVLVALLAVAAAITVKFLDKKQSTMPPEIKFDKDIISASVNATDEELLQGVTAVDPEDGDVTDSLVVEGSSQIMKGNIVKVYYAAFDSQNHVAKAERRLKYTDYAHPRFELTQPLIFGIGSELNILEYITAEDVIDGDITRNVKYSLENDVAIDSPGEYQISLSVTNNIGDTTTLPLTVEITEKEANPANITLSSYLVYIKKGAEFSPYDYLVSYTQGEREVTSTKKLRIDNNVNTDEAGVYTVDYKYNRGQSDSHTRLVVVVK